MAKLGTTDLEISTLNLGGNVFGYTADERESHEVLDVFEGAGGNFIDTADVYSAWVPGNSGGESESIIGSWMKKKGNRDRIVVGTKVSQHPDHQGLSAGNIKSAVEASLDRLQTDYIDLYYAHFDDADTDLEETLTAFDELVKEGKVRHLAGSNYSPGRVAEALEVQDRLGLSRWVALQPHYNLMERKEFEEGGLRDLALREKLAVIPYFSLAKGFLTGKYRSKEQPGNSPRAEGALSYLDDRGLAVLSAMDQVSSRHGVPVASVAIAWLAAQPTVAAPLASARTEDQLEALLQGVRMELLPDDISALNQASSV